MPENKALDISKPLAKLHQKNPVRVVRLSLKFRFCNQAVLCLSLSTFSLLEIILQALFLRSIAASKLHQPCRRCRRLPLVVKLERVVVVRLLPLHPLRPPPLRRRGVHQPGRLFRRAGLVVGSGVEVGTAGSA